MLEPGDDHPPSNMIFLENFAFSRSIPLARWRVHHSLSALDRSSQKPCGVFASSRHHLPRTYPRDRVLYRERRDPPEDGRSMSCHAILSIHCRLPRIRWMDPLETLDCLHPSSCEVYFEHRPDWIASGRFCKRRSTRQQTHQGYHTSTIGQPRYRPLLQQWLQRCFHHRCHYCLHLYDGRWRWDSSSFRTMEVKESHLLVPVVSAVEIVVVVVVSVVSARTALDGPDTLTENVPVVRSSCVVINTE